MIRLGQKNVVLLGLSFDCFGELLLSLPAVQSSRQALLLLSAVRAVSAIVIPICHATAGAIDRGRHESGIEYGVELLAKRSARQPARGGVGQGGAATAAELATREMGYITTVGEKFGAIGVA